VPLERPIGKGKLLQKKRTDVVAGQDPFKGYWQKKTGLTDVRRRSRSGAAIHDSKKVEAMTNTWCPEMDST